MFLLKSAVVWNKLESERFNWIQNQLKSLGRIPITQSGVTLLSQSDRCLCLLKVHTPDRNGFSILKI